MTTITAHRAQASRGRLILGTGIGAALVAVIVAPIALSSQDLVKWGNDPHGLGLSLFWAWIVFIALDLAAAVCVGMVTYSAWRGEAGGIFHLLTWMFAGTSAYANYRHGLVSPAADAKLFFPAMSLMGPLLLEVTLHRVKRWARIADRQIMTARPSFGSRWLPGVAFRETLTAWATAKRENIARPEDAIAHVRERKALHGMSDFDAIRYAWSALSTYDEYSARLWLQARGRTVTQAAMDDATGDRPRTPLAATPVRPALQAPPDDDPDRLPVPVEHDGLEHDRATLATLPSNRDRVRHAFAVTGSYDVPAALAWLAARGVEVSRGDAYAVRKAEQEKTRTATLRAVPQNRA
jgi:hypothetical protein